MPATIESTHQKALEMLGTSSGTLADHASAQLPERIIRILPEAQAIAEAKLAQIAERVEPRKEEFGRLLTDAMRDGISRKARIGKLRAFATKFNETLSPLTACAKSACAHCCHIPVAISETEAEIIGEAIGRKPRRISGSTRASQEYGYHRPCTFLRKGRCSIYADRPLACRLHMSLDDSDRLCELIPEATVPVPLVDVRQMQMMYAEVVLAERLADVRDFFPPA